MLRPEGEDDTDAPDAGSLVTLLALGVAVSVDEVAVGVSLGLNGVAVVPLVTTIAVWVFAATMGGLTLGARIGDRFHDHAGRVAALALIALGVLVATGIL
jgi:putative Mn2+ efflux pump MntP